MSGEEIWINDVVEIVAAAECVRCVLVSGRKKIVLRGSRATLAKAAYLAGQALKPLPDAKVLPLPKHS